MLQAAHPQGHPMARPRRIRAADVHCMDPSEKPEAVVPSELRRGRFSAPDALIASLLGRRLYFHFR